MEKHTSIHTAGTSLPVCLVQTEFPELYGMIAAMLDGQFRISNTEPPSLIITDDEGAVALSLPNGSYRLSLERPFGKSTLIEAAASVVSHSGIKGFHADPETSSAVLGDQSVKLTATEFRLFSTIAEAGGRYTTAKELSEAVWGRFDRNLCTVYLSYLRRKLDGAFGDGTLLTARGKGYRLRDPVQK